MDTTVEREQRFSAKDLKQFNVVATRIDKNDSQDYEVEFVDISRRGMKFHIPACMSFGESVQIRLAAKKLAIQYEEIGVVRSVRKVSEGVWEVSCSLVSELEPEIIDSIVARNGEEQRKHPRVSIDREVFLQREGALEFIPGIILDISERGCGLVVMEEHKVGERLLIHIEEPNGEKKSIISQVRWQNQTDNGYRIGCSFAEINSYKVLVDEPAEPATIRKPNWFLAGAVGAATVALLLVYSLFFPSTKADASKTIVNADSPVSTEQPMDEVASASSEKIVSTESSEVVASSEKVVATESSEVVVSSEVVESSEKIVATESSEKFVPLNDFGEPDLDAIPLTPGDEPTKSDYEERAVASVELEMQFERPRRQYSILQMTNGEELASRFISVLETPIVKVSSKQQPTTDIIQTPILPQTSASSVSQ